MPCLIYCYPECHYNECRYTQCHYAECNYAGCNYAECHYAECHHAECRYAECLGAILSPFPVPSSIGSNYNCLKCAVTSSSIDNQI